MRQPLKWVEIADQAIETYAKLGELARVTFLERRLRDYAALLDERDRTSADEEQRLNAAVKGMTA